MRFFFLFTLAGVISVSAVTNSHAANSAERRCGWFENPTPVNATLTDRDGMWEIGTQGGYQAKGDWPGFSPANGFVPGMETMVMAVPASLRIQTPRHSA